MTETPDAAAILDLTRRVWLPELTAAGRHVWHQLTQAHDYGASFRPDTGGRVPEHRPHAAVVSCSDARVPPSVVFDQPAGSLFVVRTAGNTVGPSELASIDYAVAHLSVPLVVVMGHTECGAVGAACAGVDDPYLAAVIDPIAEVLAASPDLDRDQLVAANVAATVEALRSHTGPTGEAARSGELALAGAVHDLRTGRLIDLSNPTPVNHPPEESS